MYMSNGQLTISICDVTTTAPSQQSHGENLKNIDFYCNWVKIEIPSLVRVWHCWKCLIQSKFGVYWFNNIQIFKDWNFLTWLQSWLQWRNQSLSGRRLPDWLLAWPFWQFFGCFWFWTLVTPPAQPLGLGLVTSRDRRSRGSSSAYSFPTGL